MQKYFFKIFTSIHVFLYRFTRGSFGSEMRGFHVLLLTSTGRKSGKKRTTPLGYFTNNGDYIIIASKGGLDYHPAWYYNLKANPKNTIQVKDKVIPVTAEIVNPSERTRLWEKLVQVAPAYSDYPKRTSREIPLFVMHPDPSISNQP